MSIFGRSLIDKLKKTIPRISLPVPPYEDKTYWDKVYQTLGPTPQDVYEWADVTIADLKVMRYKLIHQEGIRDLYGCGAVSNATSKRSPVDDNKRTDVHDSESAEQTSVNIEQEFHEAIGVPIPQQKIIDEASVSASVPVSPSILILGCGNSNLGEEIYDYYNSGDNGNGNGNIYEDDEEGKYEYENMSECNKKNSIPTHVTQCDISPNVIRTMITRYNSNTHHENNLKDIDDVASRNDAHHVHHVSNHKLDTKRQHNTRNNEEENMNEKESIRVSGISGGRYKHMSFVEVDAACSNPNTAYNSNASNRSFYKELCQHQCDYFPNPINPDNNDDIKHTHDSMDEKGNGNGNKADSRAIYACSPLFNAVIDKGLVDALFCSSDKTKNKIPFVMYNMHKILKPGSTFIFLSFSHPKYLLGDTVVMSDLYNTCTDPTDSSEDKSTDRLQQQQMDTDTDLVPAQLNLWSHVEVCQLDTIFMYRFVKNNNEFEVAKHLTHHKKAGSSNRSRLCIMPAEEAREYRKRGLPSLRRPRRRH